MRKTCVRRVEDPCIRLNHTHSHNLIAVNAHRRVCVCVFVSYGYFGTNPFFSLIQLRALRRFRLFSIPFYAFAGIPSVLSVPLRHYFLLVYRNPNKGKNDWEWKMNETENGKMSSVFRKRMRLY